MRDDPDYARALKDIKKKGNYGSSEKKEEYTKADDIPSNKTIINPETGTSITRNDWTINGKPAAVLQFNSTGKPSKEIDKMAATGNVRLADNFSAAGRKALMAFQDGGGDFKKADKILKDELKNTKYQYMIKAEKDAPNTFYLVVHGKNKYYRIEATRNDIVDRSFEDYRD